MDDLLCIQPVILCGGSGTRLWPLSRAGFPKQFLVLWGNTSLFQQALARMPQASSEMYRVLPSLIVTNEEHRFLALDQVRELQGSMKDTDIHATFLLESSARNTAPALTLAALQAIESGEDPILVVTPSDQTIVNQLAYQQALDHAIQLAAQDHAVILGITPQGPETGYGYIHRGLMKGALGEYDVQAFVEKPPLDKAMQYIDCGEYLWNAGMFVMRASLWLKMLQHFRPDIFSATRTSWENRSVDDPFVRPNCESFAKIASESIDYAVMEKVASSDFSLKVVELDAGWSDLGAWDAIWNVSEKDAKNNVLNGDTLTTDTSNTYIHSSSRLVSTVGVDNLVIVETADAVLVANKNHSQDVKKIIHQLEAQNREEMNLHRKVARPWGWYDSIDEGERFKVKRIQVKPGASLSLQMHHHRAEHWIVVKGTAEITNGEKVITLYENQSTYIPQGQKHRLKNPGIVPLEIIEVQSGSYLGEDDIVRFEDNYGR